MTAMEKKIYVNEIQKTVDGATFAVSFDLETSAKNLEIIYGQDLLDIFRVETFKNGIFRQFDKYCQYIFSVETTIIPRFNIIMVFIDCNDNVDVALDIFSTKGSGLYESEQTTFMNLFNEIQSNNSRESANMKLIIP